MARIKKYIWALFIFATIISPLNVLPFPWGPPPSG